MPPQPSPFGSQALTDCTTEILENCSKGSFALRYNGSSRTSAIQWTLLLSARPTFPSPGEHEVIELVSRQQ